MGTTAGCRRTGRRRAGAVGLIALIGAIGPVGACGPAGKALPPELNEETAPRGQSASTLADASIVGIAAADATAQTADEAGTGAGAGADAAAGADAGAGAGDGGPAVCAFRPCAPGAPCPDLIVDANQLRSSTVIDTRTFASTDCAVAEGCVGQTGTRRLLRFATATANVGTGDLVVGSPTTGACFQWSQCHQHYHFQGFSRYTLYQPDGTTVAAAGHKQAFCLEDVEQYQAAPAPDPASPFTCNNQGLHVGWEDVYPSDIDCQWIDITDVAAGQYLLEVAVNTAGTLPESDYTNDTATVTVTVPPP